MAGRERLDGCRQISSDGETATSRTADREQESVDLDTGYWRLENRSELHLFGGAPGCVALLPHSSTTLKLASASNYIHRENLHYSSYRKTPGRKYVLTKTAAPHQPNVEVGPAAALRRPLHPLRRSPCFVLPVSLNLDGP